MIAKNQVFEIEITGQTHEGLGVGRVDGMAVFVQGAIAGEKVVAKIIKVMKNYAVARIESFMERSPDRAEPFCPVYKRCGGCNLQHMTYERTLQFKRQVVIDNLERIGGLEGIQVEPVIGMETPKRYRNKAQYPVGPGKNGPIAGFFAPHSHEIIECEECAIQHPVSDMAKKTVLEFMKANNIPAYDETTHKGLIRHVVTKVGFATCEVMVIIVATRSDIPKKDRLISMLKKRIPGLESVVININDRPGNVILGTENKIIFGRDSIEDRLGDIVFEISPLSFYQVNPVQTRVLYEKAVEYAGLKGDETVFDLYCGIGTISLFAALKAKKVIGVESVPEAVKSAMRNAARNNISNSEFYCGDAEDVVPKLYSQGMTADVVIVDPPRKGCDEVLLKTLIDMAPQRIVYVSCNPSTLARDMKVLHGSGYEPQKVQPVDMFPWTSHVECVTLMSRVEK
jgi:23S rRNA m(5)U-1939 methyltransferase (EC 2.1.1.-)